jgi:hypothetical protein
MGLPSRELKVVAIIIVKIVAMCPPGDRLRKIEVSVNVRRKQEIAK